MILREIAKMTSKAKLHHHIATQTCSVMMTMEDKRVHNM
jgi:hypothetical protein